MKQFHKLLTFITTIFIFSSDKAKSTDTGMQFSEHDKDCSVITSSPQMGNFTAEQGTLELVAKKHTGNIVDNFSEENIYRFMKEAAEQEIPLFVAS